MPEAHGSADRQAFTDVKAIVTSLRQRLCGDHVGIMQGQENSGVVSLMLPMRRFGLQNDHCFWKVWGTGFGLSEEWFNNWFPKQLLERGRFKPPPANSIPKNAEGPCEVILKLLLLDISTPMCIREARCMLARLICPNKNMLRNRAPPSPVAGQAMQPKCP